MPPVMNKSFLTFKFRFFLQLCILPRACPCGAARGGRQKCQDLGRQGDCQPGLEQLESPQKKELPKSEKWSFRWFPWQHWKETGIYLKAGGVQKPSHHLTSIPTSRHEMGLPHMSPILGSLQHSTSQNQEPAFPV